MCTPLQPHVVARPPRLLRRAAVLLVVVATLAGPRIASAQSAAPPRDTVRLLAHHDVVATGVLLQSDSAGVTLLTREGYIVTYAITDFDRAEVFIERHSNGAAPLLTGVGVGLAIPLGLAALVHEGGGSEQAPGYAAAALIGLVTIPAGIVIGAVVSLLEHETWARLDIRTGVVERRVPLGLTSSATPGVVTP